MDLSQLPDVSFADTDAETIQASMITLYEAAYEASTGTKKTLAPADPVRIFLLSISNLIVQQRVLMNQAAKMNLLKYATGDFLDHIGAGSRTSRNMGDASLTTERFSLSAAQPAAITIPSGTRVSPDGKIFFATKASAVIPAGSLYADVVAECTTVGTVGNGYLAGQITRIVDPDNVPYLQSVTNLTTSSGGTDEEEDDSYRQRIYLAGESFSVAGPEGAYEYWAKSANSGIADVFVDSPAACTVVVYVLMDDGALPSAEILQTVTEALSASDIRPMTDSVSAAAPTQATYNTDFTYYIYEDDEAKAATIQQAVDGAVAEYQTWQRAKLGRSINPDELRKRIMNAGASRVVMNSPVYTSLTKKQVAKAGTTNVVYGGVG